MELNRLFRCSQMGVRKFYKKKSGSHLKILGSRRVTTIKYLTQDLNTGLNKY
jgi:hypothetical protein